MNGFFSAMGFILQKHMNNQQIQKLPPKHSPESYTEYTGKVSFDSPRKSETTQELDRLGKATGDLESEIGLLKDRLVRVSCPENYGGDNIKPETRPICRTALAQEISGHTKSIENSVETIRSMIRNLEL